MVPTLVAMAHTRTTRPHTSITATVILGLAPCDGRPVCISSHYTSWGLVSEGWQIDRYGRPRKARMPHRAVRAVSCQIRPSLRDTNPLSCRSSGARHRRCIAKSIGERPWFAGLTLLLLCHCHCRPRAHIRGQSRWRSGGAGRTARPDPRELRISAACSRPPGPCARPLVPPDPARPGARGSVRSVAMAAVY